MPDSAAQPEEYRLDSGVAVVKVTGEVDVSTCGALRDGLLRIITDENHAGLVVNLADVYLIDSTGVGILVGIWHRVGATNRGLALAGPVRTRPPQPEDHGPGQGVLDL